MTTTENSLTKTERTEVAIRDDSMTPTEVVAQVQKIQQIMDKTMKEGEHYGKIPGCGDKPTLLKAGAEKLAFTFRLRPEYEEVIVEMGGGHREYRVKTRLFSIITGNPIGQGLGSCSTTETKYRYRKGQEFTGQAPPGAYWKDKDPALIGGKGYRVGKNPETGKYEIYKEGKVENENISDTYNTVLKMAKKRSLVDAILTTTAASDIFAQDLEDLPTTEETGGTSPGAEKEEPPNPPGETVQRDSDEVERGQPPPEPPRQDVRSGVVCAGRLKGKTVSPKYCKTTCPDRKTCPQAQPEVKKETPPHAPASRPPDSIGRDEYSERMSQQMNRVGMTPFFAALEVLGFGYADEVPPDMFEWVLSEISKLPDKLK